MAEKEIPSDAQPCQEYVPRYRTGSGLRKPPPLVYRTPRRKADPHVHIPSHTAITKEEWALIKIRGAVVTGDAPGGLPR